MGHPKIASLLGLAALALACSCAKVNHVPGPPSVAPSAGVLPIIINSEIGVAVYSHVAPPPGDQVKRWSNAAATNFRLVRLHPLKDPTSTTCPLKDISRMEFLASDSSVLVTARSADNWTTIEVESPSGFRADSPNPTWGYGYLIQKDTQTARSIRFNVAPCAEIPQVAECKTPECYFLRVELHK